MSRARCKACGLPARKTQRAVVVSASGKPSPGRVCGTCARGGVLVVAANPFRPVVARKAKALPELLRDPLSGAGVVDPSSAPSSTSSRDGDT